MIIKILGAGCPKCKLLQKTAEEAAKKLGLDYQIIKIEDMNDIMQYDILATPGLVLDEYLVMSGGVPKEDEMLDILSNRKVPENPTVCKGGDSCPGGCCDNSHDNNSELGNTGGCCEDKDSYSIDCGPTKKEETKLGCSCGGNC